MSFKFLFWPNGGRGKGERTDELTGIGAKYACLSKRPLFLLDGVSMGETDDPVDHHKGESQSGVVHQGEPGYFSFDFDLRTGKNKQEQEQTHL